MEYLNIALMAIVGLSILNVWLVQNKKATRWRGGAATTLVEEFQAYGLPSWSFYLIGALKVIIAALLIAAIWYPGFRFPAAVGLGVLLLGSISMHIKIKDPLIKSLPAFIFLILCIIIALSSSPGS